MPVANKQIQEVVDKLINHEYDRFFWRQVFWDLHNTEAFRKNASFRVTINRLLAEFQKEEDDAL